LIAVFREAYSRRQPIRRCWAPLGVGGSAQWSLIQWVNCDW
jgi:hypothetical protein